MTALHEDLLIQETSISKVYDIPFGLTYTVYSKLFDKTAICKMYTEDITKRYDGWINIHLKRKKGKNPSPIGRPYHFIKDNILYVLKNNKQQTINGFALNHELFLLDWDACYILHPYDNSECLFSCSREKWLKEGVATQQNREFQVYLEIPDYEKLPVNTLPDAGKEWLEEAMTEMERKRRAD